MTPDRFMNWMLGLGFLGMFAFAQGAFYQRDQAREANKAHVAVNGALVTVSCEEPSNGQ